MWCCWPFDFHISPPLQQQHRKPFSTHLIPSYGFSKHTFCLLQVTPRSAQVARIFQRQEGSAGCILAGKPLNRRFKFRTERLPSCQLCPPKQGQTSSAQANIRRAFFLTTSDDFCSCLGISLQRTNKNGCNKFKNEACGRSSTPSTTFISTSGFTSSGM